MALSNPQTLLPHVVYFQIPLWEPNGLVLSQVVGFFSESPTRAKFCFASNRDPFRYHANTPPFMCKFKGRCLVDTLPTPWGTQMQIPNRKQWKGKESGHAPWFATLERGRGALGRVISNLVTHSNLHQTNQHVG